MHSTPFQAISPHYIRTGDINNSVMTVLVILVIIFLIFFQKGLARLP